jgi:hypothetical protein
MFLSFETLGNYYIFGLLTCQNGDGGEGNQNNRSNLHNEQEVGDSLVTITK